MTGKFEVGLSGWTATDSHDSTVGVSNDSLVHEDIGSIRGILVAEDRLPRGDKPRMSQQAWMRLV